MFITDDSKAVSARKRAQSLHTKYAFRNINELTPHSLTWADLNALERDARKAVSDVLDGVKATSTPETRDDCEAAADALGDLLSEIRFEKDARTGEGHTEPRAQRATAEQMALRPILGAASTHNGDTDHTRAFKAFLRAPQSRAAQTALTAFEDRAASGLTGAAGGFIVPEIIAGPISSRARDVNPLRNLVRVIDVASGDIVLPLSNADATSGWVGETDTRTATAEPTLDGKVPTFGTSYGYVSMSEELANDGVLNVADWFVREVGAALGEAEMAAIISGDGVKKPSGMLNVPPEAGADGARTANAYKFLPAASATALVADELLDMIYDLKTRYRANGAWIMNSATAGSLRKLKDGDGNYLWQQTVMLGQPSTFAGYQVVICEAMENLAASKHPIAFGDFDAAYVLCLINGMTVTSADQSITEPGFDKIYVRQRIGGVPYDENAVRFLKMAAS